MKSRLQNELTVLASELGGASELSEVLGLDEDVVERALGGEELSRFENSQVTMAFARLESDDLAQADAGVNVEQTLEVVKELSETLRYIGWEGEPDTDRYRGLVRSAIADGEINLDRFLDTGYQIFGDINVGSAGRVIEEMSRSGRWEEMFDAFDGGIEEFWDWFREYFYGD